MPRRSHFDSPWHNCPRCGRKTHLSEMSRQRGALVCNRSSCLDSELVGERDMRVAKILTQIANSNEGLPHEKLSDVQSSPFKDDIVF